jgi:uncharacterized membrane protein
VVKKISEGKQNRGQESWKRSLAKSISYRIVIMVLDFTAIFLFTRRADVATGFVLVSNLYTTLAYFIHERIWIKINWQKSK